MTKLTIGGQAIDLGSAIQSVHGLTQTPDGLEIVRQVVDLATLWQKESSKREAIQTKRDLMLAQIHAQQSLMETYFEGLFKERNENFERLYSVLHTALEKEQWDVVDKAMSAIVEIAKEFPLNDLDKFRSAWNDPDGPMLEL